MKKILLFIIICFTSSFLHAQEKIFEEPLQIDHINIQSHIVTNSINDTLATIVIDKKEIHFQLLDEHFNLIQKLNIELKEKKILGYIGHYYEDGIYYIYLSNQFKRKLETPLIQNSLFYVISFNTRNQDVNQVEFAIPDEYETYLSSFNRNGKMCMMFIENKTSVLHFYTYEKENVIEDHKVDLGSYKFGRYAESNLFQMVTKIRHNALLDGSFPIHLKKVDNNFTMIYNKINAKVKLYPYEEKVVLSIDERKFSSRLFTFSLDGFSYEYQEVKHPKTICDKNTYSIDSNSFLMENNLFQVSRCDKQITLSIYDLEAEKVIQTYQAEKGNDILYKNGDFIEYQNMYLLNSIYNKEISHKKAFRKLSNGTISVLPFKRSGQIEITIAANSADLSEHINSAFYIYGIGVVHNYSEPSFSPHMHFKSLVNKNSFDHIKGKISNNILDKIDYARVEEYKKNEDVDLYGQLIFKHKDYYIFGYYLSPEGKFILRKFVD